MNTPTTLDRLTENAHIAQHALQREQHRTESIRTTKEMRRDLDVILQKIKDNPRLRFAASAGLTNAAHYTINAIMWLGMELKELGEANPYPESKNPDNTNVEKTADGLKL